MEPDGQTYILPHPMFARIIMIAGGLFALVMPPWELGRALWPVNALTPFFAIIVFGGMSVGAAFLYAGLIAPSASLRFYPGMIEVRRDFLWGSSKSVIRTDDIAGFDIKESTNSDGPNDWYAVILLKAGNPIMSRPLGSKEAAETCLAEWKACLIP